MQTWLVYLIGLLGGASVGIQAPISAAMGQRVGGIASSFIVHVSGAVFSGVALLLSGGEKIKDWRGLPWYMLIAGIFGLIVIQTVTVTLPRVGSAMMVVLVIVGQLLVGVIIDHFGLLGVTIRPIDPTRVLGLVVLVVGAYLIAK